MSDQIGPYEFARSNESLLCWREAGHENANDWRCCNPREEALWTEVVRLRAELEAVKTERDERGRLVEAVIRAAREVFTADCNNECFCSALVRNQLSELDSHDSKLNAAEGEERG